MKSKVYEKPVIEFIELLSSDINCVSSGSSKDQLVEWDDLWANYYN